jgi:hypothetical protein
MKRVIVFLVFLLTTTHALKAQSDADYQPVIKMLGKNLDLVQGKTLEGYRKSLLANNFKDITQESNRNEKNLVIMEGISKGMTMTYEIFHLKDGRIYELVLSLDSDKENKYKPDVKLMAQRIAFNNVSNALYKELGKPNISIMDWKEPYTQADWEDHAKTAAALINHKLLILFGYASAKYDKTEYEGEPSLYISLDPLLRIRMGVKDVELYKLYKNEN